LFFIFCFVRFSSFPSLISPSSDDKKEAGLVLPHQIHNVTGRLQEVMKESVTTAFSFTKKFLLSLPEDDDSKAKGSNADSKSFFRHHSIHLHVPEGSIPKDGPSAGVALATSFLRLVRGSIRFPSFFNLLFSRCSLGF
jgi:ATP-dependent Lon protease